MRGMYVDKLGPEVMNSGLGELSTYELSLQDSMRFEHCESFLSQLTNNFSFASARAPL